MMAVTTSSPRRIMPRRQFGQLMPLLLLLLLSSAGVLNAQQQENNNNNETTTTPELMLLEDMLASDFGVSVGDISVSDGDTGFSDLATLHNDRSFVVEAALSWENEAFVLNSTNQLHWECRVNGKTENTGTVDLRTSRALPDTLNAGSATVTKSGKHTVQVLVSLDDTTSSNERSYQSFDAGASFVPLIMVLIFAVTTANVELSLGVGIFAGACMVTGTIADGFKRTFDTYILEAIADEDHAYVYLFTLFLSGMVGIVQRAGGLRGITTAMQRYINSPRSAQGCTFLAGLIIFFDDYANTLVAGMSMRPLSDVSMVSREKLAFIVDATAAPIASIVPISAWVGFEVSLIQQELDKIVERDPNAADNIATTGFAVFLETIRYRYYCIFMLFLVPLLVLSQRDMGPMLIAERRCRLDRRTDGGDGASLQASGMEKDKNDPSPDTPGRWWNMALPIVLLVFYIFWFFVVTGDDGTGTQTFQEIIENSNSYKALLWGTMAAAITAFAFYLLQDKKDGRIVWFNAKGHYNRFMRAISSCRQKWTGGNNDNNDSAEAGAADQQLEGKQQGKQDQQGGSSSNGSSHSKPLLTWHEAMDSFMIGMERIFPALVVLTLAWASGSVIVAVGLDRFFGDLIVNGSLPYQAMPTISYLVSMFVAFATGTSWGTMTIMFPLLLVPTYTAAAGDAGVFYATTAGILAGAVAGDHASPISDTTVLSSLASECQLFGHVRTQAPYVLVVTIWVVLIGTVPAGWKVWANGVSVFLGFVFMVFHALFTSEAHLNPTGRYDIITELYLKCNNATSKDSELEQLRERTQEAFGREFGEAPGFAARWFNFGAVAVAATTGDVNKEESSDVAKMGDGGVSAFAQSGGSSSGQLLLNDDEKLPEGAPPPQVETSDSNTEHLC